MSSGGDDNDAAQGELDALVYAISHDLRAPLRSITAFNQLLQEHAGEQLDEQSLHCLARIQEGVARMSNLIDALLQLSRVNRADLTRRDLDLSELTRELGTALQARAPLRKLAIRIEPQMRINADSRLARQLLEALLDNAYKFSTGRPQTELEIGHTVENGTATYFVRDNGIGFNNAYAAKLGRPFQRIHTDPQITGVGIGLAIAQRIAARHGGKLWGEGTVDQGATFYFTLN
jgi:light-regulated signal transduction histidine kinase (bacteriophytochrome)